MARIFLALLCAAMAHGSPIHLTADDGSHGFERQHATLCIDPKDPSDMVLVPGIGSLCPEYMIPAATGSYADTIHAIGWGQFEVRTTDQGISDHLRAFAAGYVEGHLTAHRIRQQIANYRLNVFKNADAVPPPQTRAFLARNIEWAREHSEAKWMELEAQRHAAAGAGDAAREMSEDEKYWRTVHVIMAQFDGLVHGYSRAENIAYREAEEGLNWINSNNEIDELMKAVFNETAEMPVDQQTNEELSMLSCSAFVALMPGNADILLAHDTWRGYFGMLRIFKYYKFSLSYTTAVVGFSSAAGTTSSHDDFYMTNKGLAIAETTNSQFNTTWVKENARPESLVVWQRSNVANILADSGREWADIFARENSGLYPNQWMIVDYNLFEPGAQELPDYLLTISEQLPNRCVTGDGTPRLRTESFWPSYNIPYFKEVFELSGYPAMVQKRGDEFTYDKCPRAKIFTREGPKVKSMEDAMRLIRLNEWPNDPLSSTGAHNAISSRFDLAPQPKAFGGVDGKITSHRLMRTMSAFAQSGPTAQNQEPFSWSRSNYSTSVYHMGLPDTYDFPWVRFEAPFSPL